MVNPADYISGLGAALTGIGLIYAGLQLRLARKIAKAQFILHFDNLFLEHLPVAKNLRGKWRIDGGPGTLDEWIAVEAYMGLFERIQIMIEDGVIDLKVFDQLYGYRLFYIVENTIIREHKLVQRKDQWVRFIKLWRSLASLEKPNEDLNEKPNEKLNEKPKIDRQLYDRIPSEKQNSEIDKGQALTMPLSKEPASASNSVNSQNIGSGQERD